MCCRKKPVETVEVIERKRDHKTKVKFENSMTKKLKHAIKNRENLDEESQKSETQK
jgi:hypothetical protein